MIQRIQSLFLLAAAGLQIFLLFSPVANFALAGNGYAEFWFKGFTVNQEVGETILLPTAALNILGWFIAVLGLLTIFLFKRRVLQIRLCVYAILLNIGQIILIAFYIYQFNINNAPQNTAYSMAIAVPAANVVLTYLAFRAIRKDELLVKAYERLR
ncbi:MAG: DUF4293 domain-containing protein [Bacteroidales bacterium]|nr:DUF4293 domain-containing protein [Bacteroidales bacterium]